MYDLFLPMTGFAVVSMVTPGPNNLMLTSSGLTFGFKRTIPHMLGVALGFSFMVLIVGLGLAELFTSSSLIHQILRILGTAYIAYLAYKIGTQPPVLPDGSSKARPMRFFEAAAFQWVNPKAWVMAVGAVTGYTTLKGDFFLEVLIISATYLIMSLPVLSLWVTCGTMVRRWLSEPHHIRAFNIVMALLLLASIVPLLQE
jgi:threonine/homoserine/homoserine lactone efflux protein